MGDLSNTELQGVAGDIQKFGKLQELADALEVVPLLESLEGDTNAPLTLLQRWRSGVESSVQAHSLLVHHLRCIGLVKTADRWETLKVLLNLNDEWFVPFADSIFESFFHNLTP